MPKELEGHGVLVSGHHGMSFVEGDRIVLDRCGGKPEAFSAPFCHPLEAVILPERLVLGHDGSARKLTSKTEPIGIKVDEDKKKADEKKAKEAREGGAGSAGRCEPCES